MNHVKHTFDIIIDNNSKILILGSIPSIKSREKNFYYMNSNNRFYKVLEAIFDDNFTNEDINIKIELLKKHHIALYDVISECDITNSSDQSIKKPVVARIDEIVLKYKIDRIFLNGKKAYSLFIKYFPHLIDKAILLPSTSSANAAYSLDKLINEWKIINQYL